MPTLQVTLQSARNLVSGGLLGTAEHYAVLSVGQQTQKSGLSKSKHDPVWDETFEFFVNPNDVLTINVYDQRHLVRDTALGTASLDLSTLTRGIPQRHQLFQCQNAYISSVGR
jgi:Ca2+-dependent lipid-binding protein